MQKQQSRRHQVRPDGHERYVYQVRQLVCSCECCSKVLRQTHDYVRFGHLCWVCWRRQQPLVDVSTH